jgi:hypothetical protein
VSLAGRPSLVAAVTAKDSASSRTSTAPTNPLRRAIVDGREGRQVGVERAPDLCDERLAVEFHRRDLVDRVTGRVGPTFDRRGRRRLRRR